MVSAVASSRMVNTFIACWVIILEVARAGMARTVERGEVRRGGGIVAGRMINGTAPGVLFRVTRLCNCGVCFIALFAVGFHVCMIGSSLVIRGPVRMGVALITLCCASLSTAWLTLCSSKNLAGCKIF